MMPYLDPYETPPEQMRALYKRYHKLKVLPEESQLVDLSSGIGDDHGNFQIVRTLDVSLLGFGQDTSELKTEIGPQTANVYESTDMPGLHIIPSLYHVRLQGDLLSRLLHRDLADTRHQTNLHKFYNIPYDLAEHQGNGSGREGGPAKSFFFTDPCSHATFSPLDPSVHKPLTISQVLNKKLRWITLGGQYDWTDKKYPESMAPEFPKDIADMICQAFPDMTPEAAIVNIYSPGDTLNLHRDVSEESDEGLVSVSIGCDAIFVAGLVDEESYVCKSMAIRLRSGDAIYMSGKARYAWHGVPTIFANTCPSSLSSWPAQGQDVPDEERSASRFELWRGWMKNKRINLNIRQMNP